MAAESTPEARPSSGWRVLAVVCVVAVAAVGFVTRPFGWAATVLVVVVGVAVLIRAIRSRSSVRPKDPPLRRGTAMWSALLLAIAGWEAYAFVRQPDWTKPSDQHPTLSTLLDPGLEQGPLRFAGWLVWLAVGCWLATR
ncbi:DUF2484 family protein [Nocardia sp. NPDC004654]|uniref:DUF2484 family protein n=1 Tax=Nocardia sp. NPDC004654 TaxID=3154776 RepID=UPI0033AE9557